MKYKIGDIVQIVKVNIPDDLRDNPNFYISQVVEIIDILESRSKYPYRVKFNENFKGDKGNVYWSEDELDYPDDKFQERIIWNKLIALNYDIMRLPMISDYKLKGIYNLIEEYKINGGINDANNN